MASTAFSKFGKKTGLLESIESSTKNPFSMAIIEITLVGDNFNSLHFGFQAIGSAIDEGLGVCL